MGWCRSRHTGSTGTCGPLCCGLVITAVASRASVCFNACSQISKHSAAVRAHSHTCHARIEYGHIMAAAHQAGHQRHTCSMPPQQHAAAPESTSAEGIPFGATRLVFLLRSLRFCRVRSRFPLKGRRQHTGKSVTRRHSISQSCQQRTPRRALLATTACCMYTHACVCIYIHACVYSTAARCASQCAQQVLLH